MDYEDILNYIEDIVEEIDFEEISVVDIQTKLQELIIKMEDNNLEPLYYPFYIVL